MAKAGSGSGYSGTPLPTKLGLKEGSRVALVSAPPDVLPLFEVLPPGVSMKRQARGTADVVVAFFIRRSPLSDRIEALGQMIFPAGGLWIAWPKRASGVATDITEQVVREVALPLGLVDNKVCAVDGTWTGLRLVWRVERRGAVVP